MKNPNSESTISTNQMHTIIGMIAIAFPSFRDGELNEQAARLFQDEA